MKRMMLVVLVSLMLGACQGKELSPREKGALAGGALGAGLGAIVGNQTGDTGAGVAIGSAGGALIGGLVGNEVQAADAELAETDQRLEHNQQIISENQRLIDELKRRGADVRQTKRGVIVNLPDVLFEFDKSSLTADAQGTLYEVSDVLRGVQGRRIAVEGHTDSVGTISYNQRLSEDRARSVASELVRTGISRRRISTRGFGESDPIASNRTSTGRARNRRVEVIVENY